MTPLGTSALTQWPIVAAQAILFGTTAFAVSLAPRDSDARSPLVRELTPLWRLLAAILLLAAPVALLMQVAAMAGVAWRAALPFVPEVLRETHVGRAWIFRIATIAAIAVTAFRRADDDHSPTVICALAWILILEGSVSSHANDWSVLMVAINFIHQAAAGLWAGALIALCYGEILGDRDPAARWIHHAAPRVSATAGWAVGALFVTGAALALRALGADFDRLLYSAYGRALIMKLALFSAVVAVGGYNRQWLVPNVAEPAARRLLIRLVAVECGFILGVFGLAAILANTPPAH